MGSTQGQGINVQVHTPLNVFGAALTVHLSVHNGRSKKGNLQWCEQSGFGEIDNSWVSFVEKVFGEYCSCAIRPYINILSADGDPFKSKQPAKPANAAGPSKREHIEIADDVNVDDPMDGNGTTPAQRKKPSKKSSTTTDARTKGKKRKADPKGKQRAEISHGSSSDSHSSSDSDSDSDLESESDPDSPDTDGGKSDESSSSSDESDTESAKTVAVESRHRKVLDELDALLNKVEREAAPGSAKTAVYQAFNKFSRRMGKKVTDFVENREISMAMNDYYFERIGLKNAIPEGLAVKKDAGTRTGKKTKSRTKKSRSNSPRRTSSRLAQSLATPAAPSSQHSAQGQSTSRHASNATQPPITPAPSHETDDSDLEPDVPSAAVTQPNNNADDLPRIAAATNVPQWAEKALEVFNASPGAKLACCAKMIAGWTRFEQALQDLVCLRFLWPAILLTEPPSSPRSLG